MKESLVLLAAADPAMQHHLRSFLDTRGHEPLLASSVDEAIAAMTANRLLFSLVDMNLDGADGIDFLRRLGIRGGDPGPIIFLSDEQDFKRTVEVTFLGAEAIIPKPFHPGDLEKGIQEVLSRPRRAWGRSPDGEAVARLRQEVGLWRSPTMQKVWQIIEQAAGVDVTVLICGETGTGKELVARAIHYLSSRHGRPFVKVNCAAVPRDLLESELFGHERGAFTGAHQLKIGRFEAANSGTIFLDEIGDLHPALQAKLLHVLQDGEFSRVGGRSTIKIDVRVLAATNQNLERAVAAERFRDDLYYRLNVIEIIVPPLRERVEEIPLLAEYFLQRYSEIFHRVGFELKPGALDGLIQQRFPGNVRELENLIKRMIILNDPGLSSSRVPLGEAPEGDGDGLPAKVEPQPTPLSLKEIAQQAAWSAEREAIGKMLQQTGWNRSRAAKLLNISYRALLYKIKQVGLHVERSSVTFEP